MNRDQFIKWLEDGKPATIAVKEMTGFNPYIFPLAEGDDKSGYYVRYGVMMAGPAMVALVILEINTSLLPEEQVNLIKSRVPCGAAVPGMERTGYVQSVGLAVKSGAKLRRDGVIFGEAQEIFTESLFR